MVEPALVARVIHDAGAATRRSHHHGRTDVTRNQIHRDMSLYSSISGDIKDPVPPELGEARLHLQCQAQDIVENVTIGPTCRFLGLCACADLMVHT